MREGEALLPVARRTHFGEACNFEYIKKREKKLHQICL